MNKKLLILITVIVLFISFIAIAILQYRSQQPPVSELVPLIPVKTSTPRDLTEIPTPTPPTGIPVKIDTEDSFKDIDPIISSAEKDKVYEDLPYRIENFPTSGGIETTINIFSLLQDPEPTIRIEVYNVNFNNPDINGRDAIAFKESFIKAKEFLQKFGVDLKKTQIIYGNRQYIQDTASYWVLYFNLL